MTDDEEKKAARVAEVNDLADKIPINSDPVIEDAIQRLATLAGSDVGARRRGTHVRTLVGRIGRHLGVGDYIEDPDASTGVTYLDDIARGCQGKKVRITVTLVEES